MTRTLQKQRTFDSRPNDTTDAMNDAAFSFVIPPRTYADNSQLVAHITKFVNDVFEEDEGNLWDPDKNFQRTNAQEVEQLLRLGELALICEDTADATLPAMSACAGCGRLSWVDDRTGNISMIAVAQRLRSQGTGRALMLFAEEHFRAAGAKMVQVELLMPLTWSHPSKVRLEAWYRRMGYQMIREEGLHVLHPQLAPLLSGPSILKIWQKPLSGSRTSPRHGIADVLQRR